MERRLEGQLFELGVETLKLLEFAVKHLLDQWALDGNGMWYCLVVVARIRFVADDKSALLCIGVGLSIGANIAWIPLVPNRSIVGTV